MDFRLLFGKQHKPQKTFEQRKGRIETMVEEWSSDPTGSDPGGGAWGQGPGSLAKGEGGPELQGQRKWKGDGYEN